MKKLLVLTTCALFAICVSTGAMAQKEPKEKADKDKSEKNKLGDYDEIVIKRKGEKGGKVTIEIKGDDVLVNGKPLSDYDDDNISVRKNDVTIWNGRALVGAQASPFKYKGDAFTFSGDKAFLGVTTDEDDKGARITNVTDNSAAEKAGLKENDVIIRVDDTKIENQEQLSKAITKHKPEEKVTVVYLRGGKEQKVVVPLGRTSFSGVYAMPKIATAPDMNFNFDHDGFNQSFYYGGRGRIGIKAQDTEEGKGVKVLEVNDESLAEKAGLKEGDIITEFDGKAINSADELAEAAKGSKEKNTISIKFTRDGKAQSAEIKIPKKLKTTNL